MVLAVHRLSSWLCLFLLVVTVHAQVDVKLEFDQNKFLTGETSEVILRIANFTGGPLRLGERSDWLRFSIENVSGVGVASTADLDETGAFTLKTGARATLRFNLTPCSRSIRWVAIMSRPRSTPVPVKIMSLRPLRSLR